MRALILSVVLGTSACIAAAAPLVAQQPTDGFSSISSYSLSVPFGDTRRFITTPSWLGLGWDLVWRLGERTSAGVAFSMHDFNDASSGTRNYDWGAATGQQMRDLVVTTVMATGRWYPLGSRTRRGHLGLSGGVVYMQELYQLGLSQTQHGAAHLAAAPEAGWQFPLVDGIDALVSARYTIPATGGSYLGGSRSYPFATVSFGILAR
jgi:hypothetical protein